MRIIGYRNKKALPREFAKLHLLCTEVDVDLLDMTDHGNQDAIFPIEEVDALFGSFEPEEICRAKRMKWYQSTWAGVDELVGLEPFRSGRAVLTNAAGAYDQMIAEYVTGACLSLLHRFPQYQEQKNSRSFGPEIPAESICGKKITVLGAGSIGRTCAGFMSALGAVVTGVSASAHEPGVEFAAMYRTGNLPQVLKETEILIMCLPITEKTRGIIGDKELELLPAGAYVVNAGRGATLDVEALARHLQSHLAGAWLDVFPEEPVPEISALWEVPNLFMTPHIAGCASDAENARRIDEVFIRNLHHWVRGEPLETVIDCRRGY